MNLKRVLHELDEAVFPSGIYCASCGCLIDRSRSYSLCDDCISRFHWITGRTCAGCGKAMPPQSKGRLCYDCMREPHFFEKGYSCLTYGLHERELMMGLKYGGKGYLARVFGDILFDRMEPELAAGASDGCGRIDLVCPVPVSRGRLQKRGYNQSAIMSRQFVRRWREAAMERGSMLPPAPVLRPGLLYRAKETQMLRSLNPTERRMALEGAFAVAGTDLPLLKGKNVLLIDDIYTTGATADACSKVLLEGGASKVFLLSLASGGNRKPEEEMNEHQ